MEMLSENGKLKYACPSIDLGDARRPTVERLCQFAEQVIARGEPLRHHAYVHGPSFNYLIDLETSDLEAHAEIVPRILMSLIEQGAEQIFRIDEVWLGDEPDRSTADRSGAVVADCRPGGDTMYVAEAMENAALGPWHRLESSGVGNLENLFEKARKAKAAGRSSRRRLKRRRPR